MKHILLFIIIGVFNFVVSYIMFTVPPINLFFNILGVLNLLVAMMCIGYAMYSYLEGHQS